MARHRKDRCCGIQTDTHQHRLSQMNTDGVMPRDKERTDLRMYRALDAYSDTPASQMKWMRELNTEGVMAPKIQSGPT
jgi:hypothetical protein